MMTSLTLAQGQNQNWLKYLLQSADFNNIWVGLAACDILQVIVKILYYNGNFGHHIVGLNIGACRISNFIMLDYLRST